MSRKFLYTLLRVVIAVCLLIYLSISEAIDWQQIWELPAKWSLSLMAFFLLFGALVLQALRFRVLLKPHGMILSFYSAVKLLFIGLFFNSCLPGANGGDVVKIYYATEGNKGRRMEIASLVVFDRAIGLFVLLLLPVLFSFLFPGTYSAVKSLRIFIWTAALVSAAMAVGVLICFLKSIKNSRLLLAVEEKFPMGNYVRRIFNTVHLYRQKPGALFGAMGITLIAHIMNIGVACLVALAINPECAVWALGVIVPLGLVANSLPITPAGLGVGESAFNALFLAVGIHGGAGILLGWRFLMILMPLIGLVFYLKGHDRFVHAGTHKIEGGRRFFGVRFFEKGEDRL